MSFDTTDISDVDLINHTEAHCTTFPALCGDEDANPTAERSGASSGSSGQFKLYLPAKVIRICGRSREYNGKWYKPVVYRLNGELERGVLARDTKVQADAIVTGHRFDPNNDHARMMRHFV